MLARTPGSAAARARSPAAATTAVAPTQTRLVFRLATSKTSEAGTQTPTNAPKNAKPVKSADMEDFTWLKAQTPIKVFSGVQYVENYLGPHLEAAGFTNAQFVEPRLDKYTAGLAVDTPIVCLFVNDECTESIVAKLAKCGVKLIAMRCAGYDRVDLAACEKYGIRVVRVPTYSPTSVAEHALALLFALNRRINIAYTRVMAGNYSLGPLVGMELRGKNVAVIGTGAIGTEAIKLFKGIGMNVMAYDVAKNPAVEQMGVPYMSIEDMLPIADVVSLHVPLLPSTYHIMNKPRFAMMKKGALLLNVSRGGLVDSDEMMHALERAQLGGVGLDVWENEADMFFTDWTDMDLETRMKAWDRKFYALTSFPQVIVTPHSAFLTHEALANIAATTVANMEEFLLNKPLTNEIKPKPRVSPLKQSS